MLTTKLPNKLPVVLFGAVSALLLALCFTFPVAAAGPVDAPPFPDMGRGLPVQGPNQSFQGDLTVRAGEVYEGDVSVFSGDVDVHSGGRITGNLFVFAGDLAIEEGASVEGNVTSYSGDVAVGGTIGGDLAAMSGDVELDSTARVEGDLSVWKGDLERSEGAVVGGNVVEGPTFRFPGAFDRGRPNLERPGISFGNDSPSLFGRLMNFIGRLVAAALMTALVMLLVGGLFYVRPQLIADTRRQLNEQLALSAVLGVLANLTVLFLAGLLAVTLCLLPLALIPMLFLLAVNVVGWAVASQIVGERLVSAAKQVVQPALSILVGAFFLTGLVALLWALGGCFQFLASLLAFGVSSLGTGAVLVPWINRRRGAGGSSGDDDVPPGGPVPPAPVPPSTEAMAAGQRDDVVERGAGEGDMVETDVAAPVDYVTAEEINESAERDASEVSSSRARSSRRSTETDATIPTVPATADSEEETVEQDVAAPVDYVTAQEINTTDVISEGDDFLQIKGIGPTYARRLKDAGFATFAQLAAATPEELAAAIGWPPDRVRRSEVIDQAKMLAQK